jgi:hypothetical protein
LMRAFLHLFLLKALLKRAFLHLFYWTHFWCEIICIFFTEHTFDAKLFASFLLNTLLMQTFLHLRTKKDLHN